MMSGSSENTLLELLAEAETAEKIVLPEEVRAQLTGFDVVRLRLLTFRNICMRILPPIIRTDGKSTV